MPALENVASTIAYNAAIKTQNAVVHVAPVTPVSVPKPVRARGTRRRPVVPQTPPAIGFTHSDPAASAGPPVASPGPHFQQQLNFNPQAGASTAPNLQQQLSFGPQPVASPVPNSQQLLNFGPPPVDIQDPHFQLNFGPPLVALDTGFPLLAPHQWLRPQLPAIVPQQIVAPDDVNEAVPRQQAMGPAMHSFREAPRPQPVAVMPPRNMSEPLVWAHKRQQLCEVLPYYNAYQSGVYMSAGIIHSMMIDGESRPQDIFTNEIIITRW